MTSWGMMRVVAIFLIVLLSAELLSAAGPYKDLYPAPTRGHVIMIRGIAGLWPEVDSLVDRFTEAGLTVSLLHNSETLRKSEDLATIYQSTSAAGPVRIIGYSCGADTAIKLAKRFQRYGLIVERLVLLEVTFSTDVPQNVTYCYNLFQKRGLRDRIPALRGVAVGKASPGTCLINQEFSEVSPRKKSLGHLEIAADEQAQQILFYQTLGIPYHLEGFTAGEQLREITLPAAHKSRSTGGHHGWNLHHTYRQTHKDLIRSYERW